MNNQLNEYGFRRAVPTVVNVLKLDGDILSKVEPSNIYPLIKTTEFPLPSISVTRVSWQGIYAKPNSPFSLSREELVGETIQVQVNVFARSYDAVNEISELVLKAINGKTLEHDGFTLDSVYLVSAVEDVIGADVAVFQETLTFECQC